MKSLSFSVAHPQVNIKSFVAWSKLPHYTTQEKIYSDPIIELNVSVSWIWSIGMEEQHDIYVLIPFCVVYSQAHSLRRFKKDNLKSITIRSASAISKIEKQMQSALPNGIYWITHCLIAVYQRFYTRSNKYFIWLSLGPMFFSKQCEGSLF